MFPDDTVTGAADNGFHDPAVISENLLTLPDGTAVGLSNQATSQGTHGYTLNSPGPMFTITCSPSASARVSGVGDFYLKVAYNVAVYPVKINLSGVRKVGDTTYALTEAQVMERCYEQKPVTASAPISYLSPLHSLRDRTPFPCP